jgi:hypothetical protein
MTEVNARITPGPAAATGHLPAMDVPGRLRRLRTAMSEQGCEALLISNLVNVRYLSGFSGSAGVLVVRADDVVLVTDGRYGTQAPAELEAAGAPVEVEVTPASGQGEVLARLVGGAHRLGLEAEHISWGRQRQFARTWAGGVELVATEGLVEGLRQRKDAGELARIATAARIADQALESVRGLLDTKSTGTKSPAPGRPAPGRAVAGRPVAGRQRPGWPWPWTPRCAGWGRRRRPSRPSWPPGPTGPSPTTTRRLGRSRGATWWWSTSGPVSTGTART